MIKVIFVDGSEIVLDADTYVLDTAKKYLDVTMNKSRNRTLIPMQNFYCVGFWDEENNKFI